MLGFYFMYTCIFSVGRHPLLRIFGKGVTPNWLSIRNIASVPLTLAIPPSTVGTLENRTEMGIGRKIKWHYANYNFAPISTTFSTSTDLLQIQQKLA